LGVLGTTTLSLVVKYEVINIKPPTMAQKSAIVIY